MFIMYFLLLVGNLFFNPNKDIAKTISTGKFLLYDLSWMILRGYEKINFFFGPVSTVFFSYHLEAEVGY